jgi:predicted Fe-Mo cluster-binding NifX family protein
MDEAFGGWALDTGGCDNGVAAKEKEMNDMKLAVPTIGTGGLDAERSGHFGHCDCFTMVDIEDGGITATSVLENPPHEEGGCLRPVGLLANAGATAIVAAGMGARPLAGFPQAGITVYFDNVTPRVGDVALRAARGVLPAMSQEDTCQHH